MLLVSQWHGFHNLLHPLVNRTAGPVFAQWRKQTCSHAQCQLHSTVVRIQSFHVPTAKRGKSSTPVLFLEVILVFVAFDFMGCFGLVLLLTSLPLLSHSEPNFVLPSFLMSSFSACPPPSLPSILSSFLPSEMWFGWAPPT